MSASNKVTSFKLLIQTNNFDRFTLIVLSPKKFENLLVGDFGEFKASGNFFFDFSKDITSNQVQ